MAVLVESFDRAGMGRMDRRADRRRRARSSSLRWCRRQTQAAVRAAARSARGARHLTYRLYEWVDRRVFGAATRHARHRPVTDRLMGGRRPRAIGRARRRSCRSCPPSARPGTVRPRATGCGRSPPWTMAGRSSAPSRFWELREAHRHRDHRRRGPRRRLHARDRRRLRARRSTVADAHAQRRGMDLRTPGAALPAAAPSGTAAPSRLADALAEPRNRASTGGHCPPRRAHGATGGGGQGPHGLAPRRVVRRGAPAIDGRACAGAGARTTEPRGPLPGRPVPDRGRRPSLHIRRGLLATPRVAARSRSRKSGRTTRGRRRAGCSNASITSPTRSCSSTRGRSTCFRRPAKRAESNSTVPSSFRIKWRLDRVLLDGLTALDATLHIEDGLFWLFANVMEGHEDRGQLWLFSSPSLDGEWRPHPRNPIVTDPGTARPAGRLFRREGVLIRPSQDCSRGYGEAVVLNRVDALSPSEYRETPCEQDRAELAEGNRAYSHIHIRFTI